MAIIQKITLNGKVLVGFSQVTKVKEVEVPLDFENFSSKVVFSLN